MLRIPGQFDARGGHQKDTDAPLLKRMIVLPGDPFLGLISRHFP